jgi:adenine deaminase
VALDEALEKIAIGMKILIREGSAARNFDALASLIDTHPDRVMLCSDDKHPDQLIVGHIDQLVRRARARGSDLFDVLQAACVNPVRHYGLPVGLLQLGDRADFLEVDDLEGLRIRRVFVNGRLAAADGVTVWPRVESLAPNRFDAKPKRPDDFAIVASTAGPTATVRVIEALDGQLVTGSLRLPVPVADGRLIADPANDILKIAVVDRYDDRPPAVAFIKNIGLRHGAIASSVSHDSHNIVAVGTTDADLAQAVNLVIESRGGLSVAGPDGSAVLPLLHLLRLRIASDVC